MLDFSLFKSKSFNLVAILNMFIMLAYFIPFAFSSVRAEHMGIDSKQASFLISILGEFEQSIYLLIDDEWGFI